MSTSSASALRESECLFMSSRSLRSASFRANWAINFRAAVSMNSDRLLYSPMYKSIALSTSFDNVIDVLIFIPPTYYLGLVPSISNSLDGWTERVGSVAQKASRSVLNYRKIAPAFCVNLNPLVSLSVATGTVWYAYFLPLDEQLLQPF